MIGSDGPEANRRFADPGKLRHSRAVPDTRWIFAAEPDVASVHALIHELRVPRFAAQLLCQRGLSDPEAARAFLRPRLRALSDPFALPNMRAAVDRLLAAIDRRERIVLYGDYDVDGVTSLAILTRLLRAYGVEPACFLPSRMDEGYGLSPEGVARCLSEHRPQLLVAIDCGTTSVAEVEALRGAGVDVLVFDHHQCQEVLPNCTALVNPQLGGDFHYLCSAGIAFKLGHALLKSRPVEGFDLKEFLDLVALGTIADVVPLVEENRTLAAHGLRQLERSRWVGLRVLQEVAGVSRPLRPVDVGFRLGPRLNAAGRLGTAQAALELLLTEDAARARTLALELEASNRDRQAVEKRTLLEAEAQLATWFDPARDCAIVVGAPEWHPGVVGIVASRLSRTHHRPALVIGFDEAGLGKGSGRSIEGLSLTASLGVCGHLLEKFGGHEMAAGLSLRQAHFEDFRAAFLAAARALLTDEQLRPCVRLDCELTLAEVSFETLDHHDLLQPFGTANNQPIFLARGVHPVAEPRVLKEKHYRLRLRQNGPQHDAIFFNGALGPLPRPPWDIAFRLERNEFRGNVSVQMEVTRLRSAAPG